MKTCVTCKHYFKVLYDEPMCHNKKITEQNPVTGRYLWRTCAFQRVWDCDTKGSYHEPKDPEAIKQQHSDLYQKVQEQSKKDIPEVCYQQPADIVTFLVGLGLGFSAIIMIMILFLMSK